MQTKVDRVTSAISNISVRRAGCRDAKNVVEVMNLAFQPFRGNCVSETAYKQIVLDEVGVLNRLEESRMFIADSNGELKGIVSWRDLEDKRAHLRGMAVAPTAQGKGYGGLLLKAAEADAMNAGCLLMTLDTSDVFDRAVQFYRKHGYEPTEQIVEFFGMKLFRMQKRLMLG